MTGEQETKPKALLVPAAKPKQERKKSMPGYLFPADEEEDEDLNKEGEEEKRGQEAKE